MRTRLQPFIGKGSIALPLSETSREPLYSSQGSPRKPHAERRSQLLRFVAEKLLACCSEFVVMGSGFRVQAFRGHSVVLIKCVGRGSPIFVAFAY